MSHLLAALVSVLVLQASPSVFWKAAVNHTQDQQYQLVLTGRVAPDYYVHPMGDPYVGTTLEITSAEGVTVSGSPVEAFTPKKQLLISDIRCGQRSPFR